jgi:hypothetical protein
MVTTFFGKQNLLDTCKIQDFGRKTCLPYFFGRQNLLTIFEIQDFKTPTHPPIEKSQNTTTHTHPSHPVCVWVGGNEDLVCFPTFFGTQNLLTASEVEDFGLQNLLTTSEIQDFGLQNLL